MTTLRLLVTQPYRHQCLKHGLADDAEAYAREQIDRMSPSELLDAISDALDDLLAYRLKASDS